MPDVAATLAALGGCATTAELRQHHSKRALTLAVRRGDIERPERGRHTLPSTQAHRRLAHARTAVLSHLSAALHHGWKVKTLPELAQITVPRQRRLRSGHREGIEPHWADLEDRDVVEGVTSPLRTVLDCARALPFDEALAVADSALRSRFVHPAELAKGAAALRGPGAAAARRVAAHADGRAANPLESVLRALAIEEGLSLTPQLVVADPGMYAVVDLGSVALRLVVEAEGYETHGTRAGLRRDCRRHSLFAAYGWDSLRFSWEDVMVEQEWVRWVLRAWMSTHTGLDPVAPPRRFRSAA